MREIDRIIRSAGPQLAPRVYAGPSITMIGYGEMTWERPSGSGVWPVIGLALQKHYISLYVAATKDGVTLADRYRDRLGKTNNGKNCIRFRHLADIDKDQLVEAIREAVTWSNEMEERFGRNCARPVD
jgi:hypothetical protein